MCLEHQNFVAGAVEAVVSKVGRHSRFASVSWMIDGTMSTKRELVSIVDMGGERRMMWQAVVMQMPRSAQVRELCVVVTWV